MNELKVSIIIPNKRNGWELLTLISSIVLHKIDKKAEIIVVDSSETEYDRVVIEQHLENGTFHKAKFISSDAYVGKNRNIGIELAEGDVIAFLDADTKLTEYWFDELVKSFKQGHKIVAGYSPDPHGRHLPRVPIYVDGQDITYPSCNIAYHREVFEKVGKFREDMPRASDCEFNYRCVKAGYVIYYNPHMKVYHYAKPTFGAFAKQAFWNGYGRYLLNKIHPELRRKHEHGLKVKNMIRLAFGAIGYLYCGWRTLPIIVRFTVVSIIILLIVFAPVLMAIL